MQQGKGQRHEVVVLVIAVGVLACALGIFVLRSQPKAPPSAPPAAVAQAEAAPVEPPPKAVKPSSRDPFTDRPVPTQVVVRSSAPAPVAPPPPAAQPPQAAPPQQDAALEMSLVGVMSGATPVAVIHRRAHKYYVKVGETIKGYTVARIAPDRVVLAKGGSRVTLLLREPAAADD